MSNLVGRTLAKRFHVNAFLGKGGMAEVYKVWDQSRMATLAIKVLNPSLANDTAFIARFREEARALANLQHPKIVRFYSLERDGDTAFIVMDYAQGSTLQGEMRAQGILSAQRILQIMRDVCAALNYAHEMGYVHCDIKPGNIIIDRNGAALVSDFGIARATGGSLTALATAGTAGYMSPEQIQGETPTRASDIYALGVLMFEMLTGARPFKGQSTQTAGSTADRVRWEQTHLQAPSPRKYNPAISPELEEIILRCLDKDAAKRYPNVQSLLSALEVPLLRGKSRIRTSLPIPPTRQTWTLPPDRLLGVDSHQRSRNVLVGLSVAGLVIILIALLINPPPPTDSSIRPTPSFSIRPFDEKLDADKKCLWCEGAKIIWPNQPGHYPLKMDFPAGVPLKLAVGWCAIDQARLEANWSLMDFSLTIDGHKVPAESKTERGINSDGEFCYGKLFGVLEGWSLGTHTYVAVRHIKIPLSDGKTPYAAGDYIFEVTVNVK